MDAVVPIGQAGSWIYGFTLFFVGIAVVILISGWLMERRRKRRWEMKWEAVRWEMIEREKREKRDHIVNRSRIEDL